MHVKEISFSYERMSTETRFEEDAKGNSEMAYLLRSHLGACKTVLLTLREGAGRGGGGCYKTRFEEEAKGNSEMAYLLRSHLGACKTVLLTLREGAGRGGGLLQDSL